MFTRFLLLGLLAATFVTGCKTKPSATTYSGNGPTVKYSSTEAAGGPMQTSRYR